MRQFVAKIGNVIYRDMEMEKEPNMKQERGREGERDQEREREREREKKNQEMHARKKQAHTMSSIYSDMYTFVEEDEDAFIVGTRIDILRKIGPISLKN